MKIHKKTARIIGILFLIPILAYGIGDGLVGSVIDAPNYLTNISESQTQLIIGGILLLLNSITVVMIGVVTYPILKQQNHYIALGYFSARVIEAIILIVGLISLLSLIPISQEYLKTGVSDITYFKTLSNVALKEQFFAYQIAMIVLGAGSVFFCYSLYKSKLLPQFISVWGIFGYTLLLIGAFAEIFGSNIGVLLSIPGGLFEVFLAIWLISRGFNA